MRVKKASTLLTLLIINPPGGWRLLSNINLYLHHGHHPWVLCRVHLVTAWAAASPWPVSVLSQCCLRIVSMLPQCCLHVVSMLSLCCLNVVSVLSQYYLHVVSMLSPCCLNRFSTVGENKSSKELLVMNDWLTGTVINKACHLAKQNTPHPS